MTGVDNRSGVILPIAISREYQALLAILDLAYVSVGISKIGMREHPAVIAANHQFPAELCHGRNDSLVFFQIRQHVAEVRHPALDTRQFFLSRLLSSTSPG